MTMTVGASVDDADELSSFCSKLCDHHQHSDIHVFHHTCDLMLLVMTVAVVVVVVVVGGVVVVVDVVVIILTVGDDALFGVLSISFCMWVYSWYCGCYRCLQKKRPFCCCLLLKNRWNYNN